jgi:hypothetical protein
MTLGPAMSGAILDPPAAGESEEGEKKESAELLAVQRAIVDKLDAILGELRAKR